MEVEDKYLYEHYYLREERAEMKDVVVKTALLDEYPYVNKHLVVVCNTTANLYDFIKPIRAKSLGPMRFIGHSRAIYCLKEGLTLPLSSSSNSAPLSSRDTSRDLAAYFHLRLCTDCAGICGGRVFSSSGGDLQSE